MSKGKRRGKPGQRKGYAHYTPPKPLVIPPPNDPPKPPCGQAGAQDEGDSDTQELTEAVDRHVRMNTWFTGAIMIATVVQVGIGYYQWSVMNDTLAVSSKSTERQLRAYLGLHFFIDEIAEPDPATGLQRVTFRATIKNYGQTPAVGVNVWADKMGIYKYPLASPFPPIANDEVLPIESPELINPQQEISATTVGDYTSDQIRALQEGELIFVLEGRMVFEDIFGNEWPFQFFFQAGGMGTFEVGEMEGANAENYANYKPPKYDAGEVIPLLPMAGPNSDLVPIPLPESEQ